MSEREGKELPEMYREYKCKYRGVLGCFYFMSQRRGGDFQPVSDSAIIEYVVMYGSCDIHPSDFLRVIHSVDSHYLQIKAEKMREDM